MDQRTGTLVELTVAKLGLCISCGWGEGARRASGAPFLRNPTPILSVEDRVPELEHNERLVTTAFVLSTPMLRDQPNPECVCRAKWTIGCERVRWLVKWKVGASMRCHLLRCPI